MEKIILGSRGSELARRQTLMVADGLRQAWPELEVTVEIITTRGDEQKAEPVDRRAGRKGLFTGEIERALAAGDIDVAVHSAKDLPSDLTPGLEVAAALARASVDDVLISKQAEGVPLRPRAIVATGSVRRQHQLRWKQPDIEVVDLRGNVPTRLRKLVTGDWDAIVLARAGIERLGYDLASGFFEFEGLPLYAQQLSFDDFLPAGGQGVIAMQVRKENEQANAILRAVNHAETLVCLQAEREFLRLLQGDCDSPVGVLATMERGEMTLRAQIFDGPDKPPRTGKLRSSLQTRSPEYISAALYAFMYGQR